MSDHPPSATNDVVAAMAREVDEVQDDSPLRQGDVFIWIDSHFSKPWNTYGVVVTADCDLAQRKTFGQVSYIPVLTFDDYIWNFWRPKYCDKHLARIEREVGQSTLEVLKKVNPDQREISPAVLRSWIERAGSEGFLDELRQFGCLDVKKLQANVDRLVRLLDLHKLEAFNKDILIKGYSATAAKEGDAVAAFKKELQSSIASLPGDIFFISGLSGEASPGLFAHLRSISQCREHDIATDLTLINQGIARSKRVGRLRAPFLYALTQNLARVFSDIGLPEAYSNARKASGQSFVDSCWES
jgi:hypothetical protein